MVQSRLHSFEAQVERHSKLLRPLDTILRVKLDLSLADNFVERDEACRAGAKHPSLDRETMQAARRIAWTCHVLHFVACLDAKSTWKPYALGCRLISRFA